jgi:probable addiction module antidote protein
MNTEYAPLDIASHLDNEEVIAEYLTAAAENENPDVLLLAMANVAKARGMTHVAKAAGLGRESLYKALAPGAHPRFQTVQAILRALNVRMTVETRLKDETDTARLDAMTDDDIAKAVADDPAAPRLDIDWTQARLSPPPGKLAGKKRKVALSAEERREASSWKKVDAAAQKAAAKKAPAKPPAPAKKRA